MDYEIRPITDDEVTRFRSEMAQTFGEDMSAEELQDDQRFRDLMPLERTLAVFDMGEIVATFGDSEFDVTAPGGASLSMAGTTMVTVRPTHTRSGLLRAMMVLHLEEARRRGDSLAGLWASQSEIYGRFGFGLAVDAMSIDVTSKLEWRNDPPAGRVRQLDAAAAVEMLPAIYERVRPLRPGMLTRSPLRWKWRMDDPEARREGMSACRYAVYEGIDGPEGYVTYRMKEHFEEWHANGKIAIVDLVAATPLAHEALWRHVTSIDLFPNINYWNAPPDDELRFRVTSPRQVRIKVNDAMWTRILDVERALCGRSYVAAGTVILEVSDPLFDDIAGRFELRVGDGEVTCNRTGKAPDLSMGIDTLGALYLGGRDLTTLHRAGLVAGNDEDVRRANAMFRWPLAPWCPEVF